MQQKLQTLFNKDNIKHTLLNMSFVLFLLSLLSKLIDQLFTDYGQQSWQISEFLINYQGGFVRRGLIGEILFFFAKRFNIDIEWTIKIISLVCFLAVSVFFVKAFLKKGYTLYILPLCFFLGSGIFTNWWIRKDYLFFCFFIPVFWIFNKDSISTFVKFLLINILTVFIILSHEVFAFFSLPVLFLLLISQFKRSGLVRSLIYSFVFLAPTIFVFLLTLRFKGSPEIAVAIWDSWAVFFNDKASLYFGNAINALSWSAKDTFACHIIHNFLYTDQGIFSLVVWIITFPAIYYIATNALFAFRKDESVFTLKDRTILSAVLIFQLICLLPIFTILSCDYGRIVFYWIGSSFGIFLLVPKEKIEQLFPVFFMSFVESINDFLNNILRPSKTTLVFLMMFIGISTWKFVIEWTYKSTMFYNVLFIISKPLILLKEFLFYLFNIIIECK